MTSTPRCVPPTDGPQCEYESQPVHYDFAEIMIGRLFLISTATTEKCLARCSNNAKCGGVLMFVSGGAVQQLKCVGTASTTPGAGC